MSNDTPPPVGPDHAAPGATIGRYRTGPIGESGLCPVNDPVLGRDAVGRSAPVEQADALEREARFLSRLDHAGTPAVLDFVREASGSLMVLRQVEGITLAEAMQRATAGTIAAELANPTAATHTMISVCNALAAAHARSVVHRRLAPQSILLGHHGQVIVQGWQTAMADNERSVASRYMSSTAAQGIDGLHEDVRAVGACLFAALAWSEPGTAEPFARLTAEEHQRIPPGLEAIIRRALTSDASTGYGSVTALGEDLQRFIAGQAPSAEGPDGADRACARRCWLRVGIALLAAAGIAAAVILIPRLRPHDSWGQPVVSEDFSDGSWKSRWVEPPSYKGMFAVKDGQLVSIAERGADLIFKRRLSTPMAIEYTAEILPGSEPCDLSVRWSENLGVGEDPERFARGGARSCSILPGFNSNAGLAMFVSGHRLPVAFLNEPLETGRRYRFRIEIVGGDVSLSIDGQEKLRYSDFCPFTSGYIALYAHFPGKAFDDIRIYQKEPSTTLTQLSFGDALLQPGKYAEAAAVYARLVEVDPGGALGQQALYRKGIAEWKQDEKDLALETWTRVTDPALRDLIACYTIEGKPAAWHVASYFSKFEQTYHDNPAMHVGLRQTWQSILERLINEKRPDPSVIDSFLALRTKLFPEDQSATYMAMNVVMSLGRYEQCLKDFPTLGGSRSGCLLALGRTAEVLASNERFGDGRAKALQMNGEFERMLSVPGINPGVRVLAQCKLGRGEEALEDPENRHPVLLHLGRAEQLLASRPLTPRAANESLIDLGRLEEAAGAGLSDVPGSGADVNAMLMLGRLQDAETASKKPLFAYRYMAAVEAGDTETAAQLRDQVMLPRDLRYHEGWFTAVIVRPLVDRWGGNDDALNQQLRPQLDFLSGIYGKRPWFLARALLGDTNAEAVGSMPAVTEAPAWRTLATGICEELAKHPSEARAAYAAFVALPIHQRLLALNIPDPEVEWFVAWRLRVLPKP